MRELRGIRQDEWQDVWPGCMTGNMARRMAAGHMTGRVAERVAGRCEKANACDSRKLAGQHFVHCAVFVENHAGIADQDFPMFERKI